jgi:hypothetical protein
MCVRNLFTLPGEVNIMKVLTLGANARAVPAESCSPTEAKPLTSGTSKEIKIDERYILQAQT